MGKSLGCHRKSPREMKRPGKPSAPIPLGRVSASRPPRHNVGSADEGAIGWVANEGEKEEEGAEHPSVHPCSDSSPDLLLSPAAATLLTPSHRRCTHSK